MSAFLIALAYVAGSAVAGVAVGKFFAAGNRRDPDPVDAAGAEEGWGGDIHADANALIGARNHVAR